MDKYKATVAESGEGIISNGFYHHGGVDKTIIVIEEVGDAVLTSPIVKGTLKRFLGIVDKEGTELYEDDKVELEIVVVGKDTIYVSGKIHMDLKNSLGLIIMSPEGFTYNLIKADEAKLLKL